MSNYEDEAFLYNLDFSMPFYGTLSAIVTVSLNRPTLNFCTRQLQACVKNTVQTGSTLWSKHMTASSLPSPTHDAFSSAASYLARNSENEDLVNNLILAKTQELLQKQCWTFEETLANSQALLLLHIIQLLDGDIKMRSEAELNRILVQSRIMSLLERQEHEIPMTVASSPWLKWVFLESVRRTYLMYVFVEALYQNLKQGYCELVPRLAYLPLTLDGRLWDARTETDWIGALNNTSSTVLLYSDAVPIWNETRAGQELETMQEMLVMACKGERVHERKVTYPDLMLPTGIEVA